MTLRTEGVYRFYIDNADRTVAMQAHLLVTCHDAPPGSMVPTSGDRHGFSHWWVAARPSVVLGGDGLVCVFKARVEFLHSPAQSGPSW